MKLVLLDPAFTPALGQDQCMLCYAPTYALIEMRHTGGTFPWCAFHAEELLSTTRPAVSAGDVARVHVRTERKFPDWSTQAYLRDAVSCAMCGDAARDHVGESLKCMFNCTHYVPAIEDRQKRRSKLGRLWLQLRGK